MAQQLDQLDPAQMAEVEDFLLTREGIIPTTLTQYVSMRVSDAYYIAFELMRRLEDTRSTLSSAQGAHAAEIAELKNSHAAAQAESQEKIARLHDEHTAAQAASRAQVAELVDNHAAEVAKLKAEIARLERERLGFIEPQGDDENLIAQLDNEICRMSVAIPALNFVVPGEHTSGRASPTGPSAEAGRAIQKPTIIAFNHNGSPLDFQTPTLKSSPKVAIVGRYKSGKSTLIKKFLGYPNVGTIQDKIANTRGFDLYYRTLGDSRAGAAHPVFLDTEGFAQPLSNMHPFFIRDFVIQLCASVVHCMVVVVNQIDLFDMQLISTILQLLPPQKQLVVIHNVRDITTAKDLARYKKQVMDSLDLTPHLGPFCLGHPDGRQMHYVIGNLLRDDWNETYARDDVFSSIARMHFHSAGYKHNLEELFADAFSKAVSKYFEPVRPRSRTGDDAAIAASKGYYLPFMSATHFRGLKWETRKGSEVLGILTGDANTDSIPDRTIPRPDSEVKVLVAEYVGPMRFAILVKHFHVYSLLKCAWLKSRDPSSKQIVIHLVISCPGFVLTGIKVLDLVGEILLIGEQHIYGRSVPLPVREIVRSPVPIIQTPDLIIKALESRAYDCNGAVIVTFDHNVTDVSQIPKLLANHNLIDASSSEVPSGTLDSAASDFKNMGDWHEHDHRILGAIRFISSRAARAAGNAGDRLAVVDGHDCMCKACVGCREVTAMLPDAVAPDEAGSDSDTPPKY